MRVAYVCTDPSVPVFGNRSASVHVQSVLGVLLARGAEVHLLTPRAGGEPPPHLGALHLHRLPTDQATTPAEREVATQRADARVAAQLDALCRAERLDLVYERYSLWGRTATRWAYDHRVPSVLEVNAPLTDEMAQHRTLVDTARAERVADAHDGARVGMAADTSQVFAAVEAMAPLLTRPTLLIGKSTVPVGTAEHLAAVARRFAPPGVDVELAWNPEFLREGQAVADTLLPNRLVFGVASTEAETVPRQVYEGILAREVPLVLTA